MSETDTVYHCLVALQECLEEDAKGARAMLRKLLACMDESAPETVAELLAQWEEE